MISLNQMKLILGEFLDKQVIGASTNSLFKWTARGSSILVLNNLEKVVAPYKSILLSLGILNEDLSVNSDTCKLFLESAFKEEPKVKVPFLGSMITFTKADADILIDLMEKSDGS